jgi:hypothetical protein
MLSQLKSGVHQPAANLFQQHWRHLKGNYDLNSAFKKADKLPEQKHTGSWHLPEEIILIQEQIRGAPKNSKTTRDAYLGLFKIILKSI